MQFKEIRASPEQKVVQSEIDFQSGFPPVTSVIHFVFLALSVGANGYYLMNPLLDSGDLSQPLALIMLSGKIFGIAFVYFPHTIMGSLPFTKMMVVIYAVASVAWAFSIATFFIFFQILFAILSNLGVEVDLTTDAARFLIYTSIIPMFYYSITALMVSHDRFPNSKPIEKTSEPKMIPPEQIMFVKREDLLRSSRVEMI
ncbi:unnamed protein product [Moneuplotes crassus]|uniref:Uncharacterized protein n=1 Tax=Euplotes crassus TaxID=5936 RepID=A0AAD2D3N4_EUPCR|nr:unnamed protein product [Moneuplotes crassus]